eukprot:scaffold31475_cov79-Isochrysis_galbana.AAC.1
MRGKGQRARGGLHVGGGRRPSPARCAPGGCCTTAATPPFPSATAPAAPAARATAAWPGSGGPG